MLAGERWSWQKLKGRLYSLHCPVSEAWTHSCFSASFSHSITLIVLSSEEGTSELRLERLLQMVFGAMVRLPSPLPRPQESECSASSSLTLGVQIPSPSCLICFF